MKWISFLVIFLLFSLAGFGQVNLTKIPLPSTYSAEVRGVTGSTSEGETVSGAYNTTDKLFHFNIDLTGRYKLYFSPTGGTPTTLDVLWSGTYGRFLLGANDIELSIKLGRNSAAGQILTAGIATGAVTSSKILDSTIVGSDIAAGTINGAVHLIDYSITQEKIAPATVVRSLNDLRDAVRIVAGENIAVATDGDSIEISTGAAAGDITAVNAGAGLSGGGTSGDVTLSIATGGITNTMLDTDIIITDNIADGQVFGNDIADETISSSNIIDGEVKNADLAAGAVTSSKILDSTIVGSDIAAGTINGAVHLIDYSITQEKIAPATVVRSLNNLRDAVRIVAGENIAVATDGDSIEISTGAAAGDITAVNAGAGLSGGGTSGDVTLSIATGGITNTMLDTDIIITDNIADGQVFGNDIADETISSSNIIDGTIAAADIGSGQVVKSLNTLKDAVRIVAGDNVTVTTAGDSIAIAASGGGGGDITAVSAGTGLSGGGITGDVELSIATAGVVGSMIAGNSIDSTHIVYRGIKSKDIAIGAITWQEIADLSIGNQHLMNSSVTTTAIQPGAVTNNKLASNAIDSTKIAHGAVRSADILDNSILPIDLNGSGITSSWIVDGQVGTNDLANSAVTNIKLAAGAVTNTKIADLAISAEHLQTGIIAESHLQSNSVSAAKLQDNSVTNSKIADGQVNSAKLSEESVYGAMAPGLNHIAEESIAASNVGAGQLVKAINTLKDNVRIVAGSNVSITTAGDSIQISSSGGAGGGDITAVNAGTGLSGGGATGDVTLNVATGGITNSLLASNSVDSTHIVYQGIKGRDIAYGVIETAHLQGDAVTYNELADNSVDSTKIIANSVRTGDILNGTILGVDIAASAIDSTHVGAGKLAASDIAAGEVVKSINTLKDNVKIVAGSNVTVTTSNDSVIIAASGGGGGGAAYDTLAINLNWYYIGNAATTLYGAAGRNSLTNNNHAFRYWNYDGSLVEGASFVMSTEKRSPTGKAWIDLYWEGTSTSGNVYWLAFAKDITDGVNTSTAFVDSAIAIVAVPGTANTVKKTTLSFTSPTTAFQSAFAPVHISIVRRGNKATDTSTSSYNLINAIVRWEVEN